jgi:hypothetical protein
MKATKKLTTPPLQMSDQHVITGISTPTPYLPLYHASPQVQQT